jgi:drug/metabolite transporter (DMT)-like permease
MKKHFVDHWLYAAFPLVIILGGFNAIGIRFTVLELPPFWGATLRFAPAALLLFLLVFILKLPIPRGRALMGAILFGVLNFGVSYAFIYYALRKVQPGLGQVILALVPLFTLIFAVAHRQESFRWRGLLGAILALGGVVIVFWEEVRTNVPLFSLLALILGAACIAESGVVVKLFPKSHPITTNAIGMSAGSLILLVTSFIGHEKHILPIRTATWVALLFLILFGSSLLFILVLNILKFWSASTLSYAFVLFPFVSLTASAWLSNEVLNPILLVGASLVLTGAVIGIISPPRKQILQPVPVVEEVGC